MDIEEYKRMKNGIKKRSRIKLFFRKIFILIVLFLVTIVAIEKDENTKKFINDKLISHNFSFSSFKNLYNKYFGSIIPFDNFVKTQSVFDEKLEYSDISKYKDGISLSVVSNYLVPVQYSGVVVFVGEKEGYGNTVIIESENITLWYSNINSSVSLYDEVKSGEYLGETKDDKLYLVFQKEGVYVDYKDYL